MHLIDDARRFLHREGRLLERRLFAVLFEGAPAAGVVDALRGYQNADGGFGHGLEPDKRCPASLPIDVQIAFQALVAVGSVDAVMVARACDWLSTVTDEAGAVPLAFPVIEAYPRAEHWSAWTYEPGLLPTAGLAGLLHAMAVDHPWCDTATAYCWAALDGPPPDDAHALADALVFLEHVPDRRRATATAGRLVEHLAEASSYRADPDDPAYGLTPLHIAPAPAGPWRPLFDEGAIAGHLARLRADQQPDGGWPLSWEPPGQASTLEWRGMETLRAVRVLSAYDALTPAEGRGHRGPGR